jgi:hypothetical protein
MVGVWPRARHRGRCCTERLTTISDERAPPHERQDGNRPDRRHRHGRHGIEPGTQLRQPRLPDRHLQPHLVQAPRPSLAAHPEAGFIASERPVGVRRRRWRSRARVAHHGQGRRKGTDATIDALVPLLEPGDIVVDGGNAFFQDTRSAARRRCATTTCNFVGAGISGGETGALEGPSIMPGGSPHSYQ